MKKKSARHTNAWGFAIFIGLLIGLLIFAACVIKVVLLFQHSSFDGKHQFDLEIKESHQTRFVVFNPEDKSLHMLLIHGDFSGNPLLTLGIPVDATISSPADISSFSTLAMDTIFKRKLLHASTTIIDGIHLFVFIHTADTDKTISQETNATTPEATQDTIFTNLFTDETIYKEGESIAIINGTGVVGLGNKVARLFNHMGANVVSVTTADTASPTSSISYVGNSSYTLTRISQLLSIPVTHLSTAAVSDITVLLGMDSKLVQ